MFNQVPDVVDDNVGRAALSHSRPRYPGSPEILEAGLDQVPLDGGLEPVRGTPWRLATLLQ